MKKLTCIIIGIVVAGCAVAGSVHALGIRNPDQGTKATGRGEAFVATADDPSAIWYNPAGLTTLKGTSAYVGGYFVMPKTTVALAGGGTAETDDMLAALPQIYLVTDFGFEKWRFGLGVNSPFGLSIDWGNAVAFRTAVTKAQLRLININPTVAFQVTPQLSVGAGLDYYLSDTELNAGLVPFSDLGGADSFRFKGDGGGLGYNVGVLFRLNEQHSFGAAYRSRVQIDYRGTETIVPVVASSASMAADAGINFPQILIVGYSFRPNAKWAFEFNADWTGWEQLNSLDLNSAAPLSIPLHWRSSWFYEFGAEYQLTEALTVRGGYAYSENSVPDATFNPLVPDSTRHVISIGAGYQNGPWTFNLMYQYTFGPDRVVSGTFYPSQLSSPPFSPGTSADGTYSTDAHAFGISVSRKF